MTLKEQMGCLAGAVAGGLLAMLLAYFTTPGVLLAGLLGSAFACIGYSVVATIMLITWDRRHRY